MLFFQVCDLAQLIITKDKAKDRFPKARVSKAQGNREGGGELIINRYKRAKASSWALLLLHKQLTKTFLTFVYEPGHACHLLFL